MSNDLRPGQTKEGTVLEGAGVETWCIDEHEARGADGSVTLVPVQWFASASQRTSLAHPAKSELEAVTRLVSKLRRDLAAADHYRSELENAMFIGGPRAVTKET